MEAANVVTTSDMSCAYSFSKRHNHNLNNPSLRTTTLFLLTNVELRRRGSMIVEVIEKCGEEGGPDESIFMIIFDSQHAFDTERAKLFMLGARFQSSKHNIRSDAI